MIVVMACVGNFIEVNKIAYRCINPSLFGPLPKEHLCKVNNEVCSIHIALTKDEIRQYEPDPTIWYKVGVITEYPYNYSKSSQI